MNPFIIKLNIPPLNLPVPIMHGAAFFFEAISRVWLFRLLKASVFTKNQEKATSDFAQTSSPYDSLCKCLLIWEESVMAGKASPLQTFLLSLLVGSVVAGVGCYDLATQYTGMVQGKTMTVTVKSAEIRIWSHTGKNGHVSHSYEPHIEYKYTVDGREYNNDRLRPLAATVFGGKSATGTRDWAERVKAGYVPGQDAVGYYYPQHPDVSFLRKEFNTDPKVITGIGLIFFGIALFVALKHRLLTGGVKTVSHTLPETEEASP
jgi:hypothetical protein